MKQVTRCVGCDNLVGIYRSYKVHVRERVKGPLTGELKEIEYQGNICPECTARAGYKVGKKYLPDASDLLVPKPQMEIDIDQSDKK
jgi:hypothetical protein